VANLQCFSTGFPQRNREAEELSTLRQSAEGYIRLYIKNPMAHCLAEQISKRTGATLSDAVTSALEDKLQQAGRPVSRLKVDALCAKIQSLPVLDSRTADEILGYDDLGIPR